MKQLYYTQWSILYNNFAETEYFHDTRLPFIVKTSQVNRVLGNKSVATMWNSLVDCKNVEVCALELREYGIIFF